MMDNDLPDEFDLIVIGTGMIESIVAAAASRIGKTVLHVDRNDYYGGLWASFNIEGIEKYITKPQESLVESSETINSVIENDEKVLPIGNNFYGITDATQQWFISKEAASEEAKEQNDKLIDEKMKVTEENVEVANKEDLNKTEDSDWTQDKIMKNCRKFNLDLAPKLQFARGEFVELLISSNIARYSEFRSVSHVVTWLHEKLEVVPCSRSDVFSDAKVSIVEKRMLMKLLASCMNSDASKSIDYENKKFLTYLKDNKLTQNLIHFVLYAISKSTDDTSYLEGVENTKRFLSSLGRFGKTPFLYSMYGSGELPQAFCRLCAVFGGTYCLNRSVTSLILNKENKCLSIICGKQRINAENFVMAVENVPEEIASVWKKQKISRAIFITDKSIMSADKENLTLVLFPPEDGKKPVTVIEVGPATGTCPPGLFVVHVYCQQTVNPYDDLKHCVNKILNITQTEEALKTNDQCSIPNVLWSLYFTAIDASECDLSENISNNIFPCPGPDLDLDYDNAVKKAKEIFKKMYPDSEFLPRAPDPEEIIIGGDEDEEKKDADQITEEETEEQVKENTETDIQEHDEEIENAV